MLVMLQVVHGEDKRHCEMVGPRSWVIKLTMYNDGVAKRGNMVLAIFVNHEILTG